MLCALQTLVQLGIFRKTSIIGQFRVDWLRSKYRTSEWGYSVDFLRVEGYKPGELCFGIAYLALNQNNCVPQSYNGMFLRNFFFFQVVK